MARQISRKTVLRSVVSIGLLLFLVYQEFMFTIIGDTFYAFDNERLDLSIIPFALVGGLYGYVVSFICFLVIFIIKLFTDGYMAHVLAIYMLGGFSMAMAAQYRRFRTIPRTIFTFVISIVSVSLVAAMNEMVRQSDFTYNVGMLERYLTGYSFSLFITCLVLFLFFRFAPDTVKSCFPIGIGYTREYVSNLLLQNQLKKTRLSVKITLLTGILAVVMGASAALFANILIVFLTHSHCVKQRRRAVNMHLRRNLYKLAAPAFRPHLYCA
ncbi:MAG: hypothetical protein IJT34_07275, partial [Butyrivibrio sp.]|nr:hypothetical protein [Butyrivibrio sp.]